MIAAIMYGFSEGALWAVLTLGVFISFRVLDFPDMSVDGSFTLGGAVSAVFIMKGMNPFLTILIAFAAGVLAGAVTGIFHTKFKIPALLAGIMTMLCLYSINLRIMGGSANISLLGADTIQESLLNVFKMPSNFLFPLPKTAISLGVGLIASLVISGLMYLFFGTEIGCAVRASGSNPNMSRALGINTDRMIILGLAISNGLVAIAGALIAQDQSAANLTMGTGALVNGLIAIIVGGVVFKFLNGSFYLRLIGAILGTILYRIFLSVILQLGIVNTNDFKLVSAIVLLIALSVPNMVTSMKQKKISIEEDEQ